MRAGGIWTIEMFLEANPIRELFSSQATFQGVARGLPKDHDIQNPEVATVFRQLLLHGSIAGNPPNEILQMCFRRGWVHSDLISEEVHYAFASPLHESYVAWKMIPRVVECPYSTLFDMVIAVVKQFKPIQLRSPSRVGVAFCKRPIEARYQDEFYRGLFHASEGAVVISPEYASFSGHLLGRIDFFIPARRWGIEITREGNDLAGHNSRFSLQGPYGLWLADGSMEDYTILDFRTSFPQKPHPGKSFHFSTKTII
jgi:hypothetical protein